MLALYLTPALRKSHPTHSEALIGFAISPASYRAKRPFLLLAGLSRKSNSQVKCKGESKWKIKKPNKEMPKFVLLWKHLHQIALPYSNPFDEQWFDVASHILSQTQCIIVTELNKTGLMLLNKWFFFSPKVPSHNHIIMLKRFFGSSECLLLHLCLSRTLSSAVRGSDWCWDISWGRTDLVSKIKQSSI